MSTDNIRNKIWSSVTTFDKVTDECNYQPLGAFADATDRLHSISVHDVTDVIKKTRIVGGTKVTTVTIVTEHGTINLDAFRTKD